MKKFRATIINANNEKEDILLEGADASDIIQKVWDLRGMNIVIEKIVEE